MYYILGDIFLLPTFIEITVEHGAAPAAARLPVAVDGAAGGAARRRPSRPLSFLTKAADRRSRQQRRRYDSCSVEDMWRSGTNIACRKAYVPVSTEKVPNTINGCGFVSSETLSAEPVLECVHLSESIICREFRDDCAAEEGAKVNPSNAIHLSEGNDHDQRNVV
nr:uncharacterized protein LOC109161150 [Ipomoea batatas]GME15185.1 uncharacterized protein LOC109161150 [Ipomoea batatas]GME15781.1 uncharacterized protein LOC109161150 [Ipomoea batatas]